MNIVLRLRSAMHTRGTRKITRCGDLCSSAKQRLHNDLNFSCAENEVKNTVTHSLFDCNVRVYGNHNLPSRGKNLLRPSSKRNDIILCLIRMLRFETKRRSNISSSLNFILVDSPVPGNLTLNVNSLKTF